MSTARDFDIIIYGATGFTGRQAARYLSTYSQQHPEANLRLALAGRNRDKLEGVRVELGPEFAELPLLVADAIDPDALRTLTERTRVVLTTAGPYAKYGEALVRACVENSTHYVDITGETPWVRHLIDTYHGRALRKGVAAQ